jgi:hypothetical protein
MNIEPWSSTSKIGDLSVSEWAWRSCHTEAYNMNVHEVQDFTNTGQLTIHRLTPTNFGPGACTNLP